MSKVDARAGQKERVDLSKVDARASQVTLNQSRRQSELQPSGPAKRLVQHLSVFPVNDIKSPDSQIYSPYQEAKTHRGYFGYLWFFLCVVVPVAIASIYYGFIASNQYVAEFRFTVDDMSSTQTSATSGILSALGGGGGSGNKNYMVADYITSPQAATDLQKRINIVALYSKPDIDRWSRFDPKSSTEELVSYWQSVATAHFDQITGIATARVRAFSPQDALLIANTAMAMSEELVNEMSNRSQNDAVKFAQQEVDRAEKRLGERQAELARYRNKAGVIDPTSSVAASNSSLVQSQRAALAQLETQMATLKQQNLLPTAPVMQTLSSQIKSTREQLASIEADVGQAKNGQALSTVVGEYEKINLNVQFAQAMVTSAMTALDQARANAASQHVYITPYVRPRLPESSVYPRRLLSIGIVAALALIAWIIGLMIGRSIMERYA